MEKEVVKEEAETDEDSTPILIAKSVYVLMSRDHRISRNRRADWFFSKFNSVVKLPSESVLMCQDNNPDFQIVSVIPSDPPPEWSPETRLSFRYKIIPATVVTYLSRKYRIVYCIDVSPSVASVDIQAGSVMYDRIFNALKASLDGLMRPFCVPGSTTIFHPNVYITVIIHFPFVPFHSDEVIIQGQILCNSTYNEIISSVFHKLNLIESKLAEMTSNLLKTLASNSTDEALKEGKNSLSPTKSSVATSSDFSLVNLLKQALIALSLLPENSSSGIIVITDGVISVPDGRYLDTILTQLRYNTVSCSFILLSSPFHPHVCHSVLPYTELMKFISSATFGAFITDPPEIEYEDGNINIYHKAFLAWSFQCSEICNTELLPSTMCKPGEWSIRNKCFSAIRDMPILKKQQYKYSLNVEFMKVLSCRLREGFMIKEVVIKDGCNYEITLVLPWKFLIQLEYVLITDQNEPKSSDCVVSLEGPYDFLHDITCLASSTFSSFYRQAMVSRFWSTRKSLSESDKLLVHLNSFSSNSLYYTIPETLKNGVPLCYVSSNTQSPSLQSSEFASTSFAQFWKPVCMLDTTVWQKWMHTHRIGMILEHDHPLPKHLHCPNSAGRFQVVLCRQAITALNNLLKTASSFVLVENSSYVSLVYQNESETPYAFYIIRVTSKPPHIVLRLAFLVGTPGNLRHQTVADLREKIRRLTFPQRLKEPPRYRVFKTLPNSQSENTRATWGDMPCCVLLQKPIEKILIRYEKVPEDFSEILMSQHTFNNSKDISKVNAAQSTFGFKPTRPSSTASTSTIIPEVFNTVARYLHHHRWIWTFPRDILPFFTIGEAADILIIITKLRLQEGFKFAYSSAGTLTMVLEVTMESTAKRPNHEITSLSNKENSEERYHTPCILQFVMFPPTVHLSSRFDEDDDLDDTGDVHLITECWTEPQCGNVVESNFAMLNGLDYPKIPEVIADINKDCFLTLGAFEYLRGLCNNKSRNSLTDKPKRQEPTFTSDYNIHQHPFEFQLGRILPKCAQAELLFSMYFQDFSNAFDMESTCNFVPFHERANEVLYNSWISTLSTVHDKEIDVDAKNSEELLRMVLSKEDVINIERDPKPAKNLPLWKCFVKLVNPGQLIITLLPRTLRDAKLLFIIVEKCKYLLNDDETESCSPFVNFNKPCDSVEVHDSTKFRQRKISEPNCGKMCVPKNTTSTCETTSIPCGRKRIRALSGGESGPVLKKALTVDSSCHEMLANSFFNEISSKYIVPKSGKIIIKNFTHISDSEQPGLYESEFSSLNAIKLTNPAMVGSLTMPLYVYECLLSSLRDNLIFKTISEVADSCEDFRIFATDADVHQESPGPCVYSQDRSPSNESHSHSVADETGLISSPLDDYYFSAQLAYRKSYISSAYRSLQLGYFISSEDLKAVINLSHKQEFSFDLTEFLEFCCNHPDGEGGKCKGTEKTREFVQRKFRLILENIFSKIKVDSDLFYFKCGPSHRNQEASVSECIKNIFEPDLSFSIENLSGSESDLPLEDTVEELESSRRDSSGYCADPCPPLFLMLKCNMELENTTIYQSISDLPTCLYEIVRNGGGIFDNCSKLKQTSLRFVLLTLPSEVVEEEVVSLNSIESCQNVSNLQMDGLKAVTKEIKWLLRDEVNSMRSSSRSVTCDMLAEITRHVQHSNSKPGCFYQCIPLKFVDKPVNGQDKFIERFASINFSGLYFERISNYWFLVSDKHRDLKLSGVLAETEIRKENIPNLPFWIIVRVENFRLFFFSHCRYDENDPSPLLQCKDIRSKVVEEINKLIKLVNQSLLLENLDESRMCSPLLEPEISRGSLETSLFLDIGGTAPKSRRSSGKGESMSESLAPGIYSCDCVWEASFDLHPRLRAGSSQSAFSRSIQILKSTLAAFEVSNRENMFVYKSSCKDVFYLRLFRKFESIDEGYLDCFSENPSPKSSISAKSKLHHIAEQRQESIRKLQESNEPRPRSSEGTILIKIYGITEAGVEVKEQLVQSLKNKLDDAILDVLTITLDRNPHCKLTPDDVHFIQRPYSAPDASFLFSTGKYTKFLLSAFITYFHQNLLNFMNTPKYTRPDPEFHFQDYTRHSIDYVPTYDDNNLYLYNQHPGGTGSRGIACVAVTLVNKAGVPAEPIDWMQPWLFPFTLTKEELNKFIDAKEIQNEEDKTEVVAQVCVWRQGRLNLDILKSLFIGALKHAGWDLGMEYQILTKTIFEMHENSHELLTNGIFDESRSVTNPSKHFRRRNSSAVTFKETINNESSDYGRERSWSYSVKPPVPIREMRLENVPDDATTSYETIRSAFDYASIRRDSIGYMDNLHSNYSKLLKHWCSIGQKISVPSMRVFKVKFKPRHYLVDTVEGICKMIQTVSPDSSVAHCWKTGKNCPELRFLGKCLKVENFKSIAQIEEETTTFKENVFKLKTLEKKYESAYPENLLALFTTEENFDPTSKGSACLLLARDVLHWETSVNEASCNENMLKLPEGVKNLYKFLPIYSEGHINDDKASINTEKSRSMLRSGVLSQLKDMDMHSKTSFLVPRQRLLTAHVTNISVELVFYNWSKDGSDKICDQVQSLSEWNQKRINMLNTILQQKAGIFYDQAMYRITQKIGRVPLKTTTSYNFQELEQLVKVSSPVKVVSSGKPEVKETSVHVGEVYRNLHHPYILELRHNIMQNPISSHGEQILSCVSERKNDVDSSLFRFWLRQGPSASNVIGTEDIKALKQTARTIHFCMTPIFFLPRWRNAISLTRDNTAGIFKKNYNDDDVFFSKRSRKPSGNSCISRDTSKIKLSASNHWKWLQTEKFDDPVDSAYLYKWNQDEVWHAQICELFIQEYMQYLQTLGFIPTTHSGQVETSRKLLKLSHEQITLRKYSDKSDDIKGNSTYKKGFGKTYYLQKSLPGGIILLEVGFKEPFSFCKILALEAHRIQGTNTLKNSNTFHNTLAFVDECDRMKVLMHLHSFAFDFHLRCIHGHLCGKQLIRSSYNITKLLEDFMNYYNKGPNFARNTVGVGHSSIDNTSTPGHILFNYVLDHHITYKMTVLKMQPIDTYHAVQELEHPPESALVYCLSKKFSYKQSEDETQYDEFEMSLVVTFDSATDTYSDVGSLKIKYYIILTSRRELYPKLVGGSSGKLYPVTLPATLNFHGKRRNFDKSRGSSSPGSMDSPSRNEVGVHKNIESSPFSKDREKSRGRTTSENGIREEKILYMGYFSSHEQMMQEILKEQTRWAEDFITKVFSNASVDCRRQLLWTRLLTGRYYQDQSSVIRDRDTASGEIGTLTYCEFNELLELIHTQTLANLDHRIKTLLDQPINFFQTLVKLLGEWKHDQFRHQYFVSPDSRTHFLVIISSNITSSVVLVQMDVRKRNSDMLLAHKDTKDAIPENGQCLLLENLVNLIEAAVGACCYSNWITCLQ